MRFERGSLNCEARQFLPRIRKDKRSSNQLVVEHAIMWNELQDAGPLFGCNTAEGSGMLGSKEPAYTAPVPAFLLSSKSHGLLGAVSGLASCMLLMISTVRRGGWVTQPAKDSKLGSGRICNLDV